MAKSASKNRSEVEFLKGEVRRLKKQLGRIKKGETVIVKANDIIEEEHEDGCPKCGKGTLVDVDLKYIVVTSCNICDYTQRRKPNGT